MSSDVPRQVVTDPRILRALTHPIRLSLLEVLDREGPLTATEAGELIGESPASCSFHLRTLARYGFVEEAPGGRGRQRPWQVRRVLTEIKEEDLTPEGRVAARALVDLLHEREHDWQHRWYVTRDTYPLAWRKASTDSHSILQLTVDELEELSAVLHAAMERYADREARPGTLPVTVSLHAFPLRPPADTATGAEPADTATGGPTGDKPADSATDAATAGTEAAGQEPAGTDPATGGPTEES